MFGPGQRRDPRFRSVSPVVALLVGLVCAVLLPAGASGAAEPGRLEVTAVPPKLTVSSGKAALRVANPGATAVTDISVTASGDATAVIDPPPPRSLAPGQSALVTLAVDGAPTGRPAFVVVSARGSSAGVAVSTLTTIELVDVAPLVSMQLAGNSRFSDHAPANIKAVVTNASDTTVRVQLRGDAAPHRVTVGDAEQPAADFELGPRRTAVVPVEVKAGSRLRRGKTGLVVTVMVTPTAGGPTTEVAATRELETALAADLLPAPLGVSGILVLPGLLFVLALLQVRALDRRRIGLDASGAGAVWADKTWLLLAGGVSVALVSVHAALTGADLFDNYTVSDVVLLSVVGGAAGWLVATAIVARHRRDVPRIGPRSNEVDVLRAALAFDGGIERPRYKTPDGKAGLLVQRDDGAFVLSPPIACTSPDDVLAALRRTEDDDRLAQAVGAVDATFDGWFVPDPDKDLFEPAAFPRAVKVGKGDILTYREEEDDG